MENQTNQKSEKEAHQELEYQLNEKLEARIKKSQEETRKLKTQLIKMLEELEPEKVKAIAIEFFNNPRL